MGKHASAISSSLSATKAKAAVADTTAAPAATGLAGLFSAASKTQFARVAKAEEFEKKRANITPKVTSEEQEKLDASAQRKQDKKAKRKIKPRPENKVKGISSSVSTAVTDASGSASTAPTEAGTFKDARTVFIGNVPVSETIKSITKFCTEFGEVDTVRLRSVPVAGTAVDEAGNQDLVRKVCANKKDFGTQKGSLNAYVVFKEKSAVAKALAANNRVMGAGTKVKVQTDGSDAVSKVSAGRHLRIDLVKPTLFDPKRSVFIGALPHYADEEEVRNHFAAALPNGQDDIENIRIVRDADTMIGKGIAYLLLKSSDAVMQALSLHKQKYRKRWELRVTICGKRTKRTEAEKKSKNDKHVHGKGEKRKREGEGEEEGDSADAAVDSTAEGEGRTENKKTRWRERDPADIPERKPMAVNAESALKRMKSKKSKVAPHVKALKTANTRKKVLAERGQIKKDGRKGKRLGGNVKKAMKASKGKKI